MLCGASECSECACGHQANFGLASFLAFHSALRNYLVIHSLILREYRNAPSVPGTVLVQLVDAYALAADRYRYCTSRVAYMPTDPNTGTLCTSKYNAIQAGLRFTGSSVTRSNNDWTKCRWRSEIDGISMCCCPCNCTLVLQYQVSPLTQRHKHRQDHIIQPDACKARAKSDHRLSASQLASQPDRQLDSLAVQPHSLTDRKA